MDDQPTICLLSNAELDAVTEGRGGGGGGGNSGTVVEIVEISIGEIVAEGNSTVTVDVAGIGNSTTANTSSGNHHRR